MTTTRLKGHAITGAYISPGEESSGFTQDGICIECDGRHRPGDEESCKRSLRDRAFFMGKNKEETS